MSALAWIAGRMFIAGLFVVGAAVIWYLATDDDGSYLNLPRMEPLDKESDQPCRM